MNAEIFLKPITGRVWVQPLIFLWRMARLQPKIAAVTTLVVTVVGLLDGISLTLLLPLLSLIGVDGGMGAASGPRRAIEGAFAWAGVPINLGVVLGVFLTAGILQIAAFGAQQYFIVRCGEDLTVLLRRRLFDAASRASWVALAESRGGHFVNAVVSEANRVGTIYGNSITAFGLILNFVVYLTLASWLSWRFTIVTVVGGALSMALLVKLYRSSHRFGVYTTTAGNRMQEILNEHVAGAKLIRALGAGDWSRETFGAAVTAVGRWVRHNKVNTILVKLTVDPLGLAVVVAAIYVSVTIVKLPPAELLLFLVIFYRTMPRLVTLQEMLQRIIGVLPSYTAVADTLRTLEDAREPHGTRPFTGLRTQIELRNVEMRRGDRVVLADVDLVIRARETVALVGRSGAGKTTLLDLVSGILAPDRGTVLVDGVPLAEIDPAAFRTRIGLVSQDPLLFHDTIAANLRIAAPAATDAEIWDALAAAHADGFVRATRQALDTVVGDHGVRLSGGQRQRLALARALLRKPDVLLLDEPSSALDAESEAAIRSTLASLRHTVTIVVVSHRTTMVTDADHVYRIDGGRVLRTSLVDAPYAGALKVE